MNGWLLPALNLPQARNERGRYIDTVQAMDIQGEILRIQHLHERTSCTLARQAARIFFRLFRSYMHDVNASSAILRFRPCFERFVVRNRLGCERDYSTKMQSLKEPQISRLGVCATIHALGKRSHARRR